MKNKIEKYVWVGFCISVACFLIIIQCLYYGFDLKSLSVINLAYLFSFITAIVYELKISKLVFYIMIAISLFMIIYGYFFTQLL